MAKFKKIVFREKLSPSEIVVPGDTELTYILFLTETPKKAENKLNFTFPSPGANLNFFAFVLGKNSSKFNFETISRHFSRLTTANYYIRSILFDHSEVNYKGNLAIEKKGILTNAYLSHHTLMLSPDCKTTSIPSLEIEADDVKAGHSATIGQTDKDMLFYLQSRGLNLQEAEKLIVKAFMKVDLLKIKDLKLRHKIEKRIEESLKTVLK